MRVCGIIIDAARSIPALRVDTRLRTVANAHSTLHRVGRVIEIEEGEGLAGCVLIVQTDVALVISGEVAASDVGPIY